MPSSLGALAGAVASPINAYAEYTMQSDLMDKSNDQYKENSRLAYARQRRMAQDATALAAIGMREAGLNPASMSDPLSPAPITSPAHGNIPQAPKVDTMQGALLGAQIANVEAQTERTKVETQRMQDEDATADVNLRRHFQTLLDDPNISASDKNFYQSLIEHAPSYSAGSLKGLDNYFNLSKNATDTLFNRFDKEYKRAVIGANIRNNVPEWLARLPEQQFNDVVQKIGNIQANTLLLASETALNSDKADKLRAEIQKDYVEMKHVYHEDWASMFENKDYWALFMGLTQKVLPAVVEGVAFGRGVRGFGRGAVTPAGSVVPSSGTSTVAAKTALKSGTPLSKVAGAKKWDDATANIYNSFRSDADRAMFARLAQDGRYGQIEARRTWHNWQSASDRKGMSYSEWVEKHYLDGFH